MTRRRCIVKGCSRIGQGTPPLCLQHRVFDDPLERVVNRVFNHPTVARFLDRAGTSLDHLMAKLDPELLQDEPEPGPPRRPPPPQSSGPDPRAVLQFPPSVTLTPQMVRERKKELARMFHPDKARTPEEKAFYGRRMAEINAAADQLLRR